MRGDGFPWDRDGIAFQKGGVSDDITRNYCGNA